MPTQTRVVVRAIIQKNQKIILCRAKGADSYFFPGGGIEFQERATDALRREMKEELGAELIDATFIGVVENQFVENGIANHEINLVFSVTIDDVPIASREPHIAFSWRQVAELKRLNIVPKHLTLAVTQWLRDGKMFWVRLNQ